ncbi:MAG: glutamine--fructose-6-phosphate transaminase (isomerizing) [Pseudomonadota bacterium]|nr:glutamine--fructose-6-phosphate transaminase (isomerizing) [Pseudomonadota bacterium]
MCGIVGAVTERRVRNFLLEGLQRLEYRGYDSAGLATLESDNEILRNRQVGKVANLVAEVGNLDLNGTIGIAHTRWATHGSVVVENTHPHMSGDNLALVHNGIIENNQKLKAELQEIGYQFLSDTDSEVIVHLVDSCLKEGISLIEAVRKSVKRLDGAYAIAVISADFPDRIVAARSGCPLVIGKGIGENFVASDVLALQAVTDRFIFLEEGDLVELTSDTIDIWNVENSSVIRADIKVEVGKDDLDKGRFRHFMEKEIFAQPEVLKESIGARLGKDRVLEQAFGIESKHIFDQVEAITIAACGTSLYAASVARYWIEDLVGIPCNVEIASEFRYRKSAVSPNSLFVTISQSGETADTLAALRLSKNIGFFATLTICNVSTSSMVRESDLSLLLQIGSEIGVASTKAFSAQLVNLLLLTILLGRRRGLTQEREKELVEALHSLPPLLTEVLELNEEIASVARRFVEKTNALFLGRGVMYPVALEGALKLKEISYVHAEGYAAGELKHGPLALVDKNMPSVAIAPRDELIEKLKSNLKEVEARGGELIVFAEDEESFTDQPSTTIIKMPEAHPVLAPIVYVLPLQLLSYYVAVYKGTDVDQPRNLAKSVTVE